MKTRIKAIVTGITAILYMVTHKPFSWKRYEEIDYNPTLTNGHMVIVSGLGTLTYIPIDDFHNLLVEIDWARAENRQPTAWEDYVAGEIESMDRDAEKLCFDCGEKPGTHTTGDRCPDLPEGEVLCSDCYAKAKEWWDNYCDEMNKEEALEQALREIAEEEFLEYQNLAFHDWDEYQKMIAEDLKEEFGN